MRHIVLAACVTVGSLCAADRGPVITQATDPTPPGTLCTVIGDGWDRKAPELRAAIVPDGEAGRPGSAPVLTLTGAKPVRVTQTYDHSVTGVLPTTKWGVVAIQAKGPHGWGSPFLVNRARLDWLSHDTAAPGETVRAFGRNLVPLDVYPETDHAGRPVSYGGYVEGDIPVVLRRGKTIVRAKVRRMSAYDLHFVLPKTLTAGRYEVFVHNAQGGPWGWSAGLPLTVAKRVPWPTKVFDVTRFGATGDAVTDDTDAIRKALVGAKTNKGGVVYFPPGGYMITKTLFVPSRTLLKGESRQRSWIWLPDGVDHGTRGQGMAVKVGITGAGPFGLEDLSMHGVYANLLVASPLKKEVLADIAKIEAKPELALLPETEETAAMKRTRGAKEAQASKPAKPAWQWKWRGWSGMLDLEHRATQVHIRRCRIFHEPTYRYHHRRDDPFLNRERLNRQSSWWHFAAVALCGDHIEVTDCDIKGGGLPVMLYGVTRATVARNELHTGSSANGLAAMSGAYPKTPVCDRVIVEDNMIRPSTNRNHSGFWAHASATRFYFARNYIRLFWVCDVEGILFHGAGYQVVIQLSGAQGKTLRFKPEEGARWFDDCKKARKGTHWMDRKTKRFKPDIMKHRELVVVKGKGLGQRAMVTASTADSLTVDRPWRVEPDATSMVAVCQFPNFRQIVVVDNVLDDVGAGIMPWGNSYDFVADGNTLNRSGGVYAHQVAHIYREWSGNFFFQALHNTVTEGRYYGGRIRSWTNGISGIWYASGKRGIGQLGTVFRANRCETDSSIVFWPGRRGWTLGPTDVGTIVEQNRFVRCKVGIEIGEGVRATLRNNRFDRVDRPTVIYKGDEVSVHPAGQAAVPLQEIRRRWASRWPSRQRKAWAACLAELDALARQDPKRAATRAHAVVRRALATVMSLRNTRLRNAALAVMLGLCVPGARDALAQPGDRALAAVLAEAAGAGTLNPPVVGPDGRPVLPDAHTPLGAWLNRAAPALWGAGPDPFHPLGFAACTAGKDRLNVIVTTWPGQKTRLPNLTNQIRAVRLLHPGRSVAFTRDDRGIYLDLTGPSPDPIAPIVVLELDGPPKLDKTMFQTLEGALRLTAERADVHGDTIRFEPSGVIGFWSDLTHWVSWQFVVERPGAYWVGLVQSVGAGQHGARYTVSIDDKHKLAAVVRPTGGWEAFVTEPLGVVQLTKGRHVLTVRPTHIPQNWVMNLREVILKPAKS